jgi:glutathione S-transferase
MFAPDVFVEHQMSRHSVVHRVNVASSLASTLIRVGQGIATNPARVKPEELLELYEFEGCPYCRLVREALTMLDLDARIYPCPKGGERFRPALVERGGKAQFPYLVDPNTGREMYESADIVRYLFETYGRRKPPLHWRAMFLQQIGSGIAGIPRLSAGVRVRPSKAPAKPLELYSFESSPFARPVRELLCEMEIPYILRSCGRSKAMDWVPPIVRDRLAVKGQPDTENRLALLERAGRISIPYLVDPNTGAEMSESEHILVYLKSHYAA